MSKKTLKFNNIEVNKKEFYASKKPIALKLVNVNQIWISGRFEHRDKSFKHIVGLKDDNIIRPLSIYYLTSNEWIHKMFW